MKRQNLTIFALSFCIGLCIFLCGCQAAWMTETYKAPQQSTTPSHSFETTRPPDPNFDGWMHKTLEDWLVKRPAPKVEQTTTWYEPPKPQPAWRYAKQRTPYGWQLIRFYDDANGVRYIQPIEGVSP